jgi:hypothetical protein
VSGAGLAADPLSTAGTFPRRRAAIGGSALFPKELRITLKADRQRSNGQNVLYPDWQG